MDKFYIGQNIEVLPSRNPGASTQLNGRKGVVRQPIHQTEVPTSGKKYMGYGVEVEGYRDRFNANGYCVIPEYRLRAADDLPPPIRTENGDVLLELEMDGVMLVRNGRHVESRGLWKRFQSFLGL